MCFGFNGVPCEVEVGKELIFLVGSNGYYGNLCFRTKSSLRIEIFFNIFLTQIRNPVKSKFSKFFEFLTLLNINLLAVIVSS